MANVYNKALEAYALIFNEYKGNTFDERMQFQKTIYLLRLLKPDFSALHFTWYLRGPYCFDLMGVRYKADLKQPGLSGDERSWIKKHKEIILGLLSSAPEAELHSSVAYLSNEEKLSDTAVVKRMSLVKPWFSEQKVRAAIEALARIIPH